MKYFKYLGLNPKEIVMHECVNTSCYKSVTNSAVLVRDILKRIVGERQRGREIFAQFFSSLVTFFSLHHLMISIQFVVRILASAEMFNQSSFLVGSTTGGYLL
jgi:hypothetical protein